MQFGDSPEVVERELEAVRKQLEDFESGADSKRMMARLRANSPMHPVLVGKGLFKSLLVVTLLATSVIIAIPVYDARSAAALQVSNLDAATGLQGGLPAVLVVLAVCWAVGWLMLGQAAIALAREAPMLPLEQKQHQRLVNEVTRLSSQRSVMERIRGTPVGAKPRLATPVPMSMRHGHAQSRLSAGVPSEVPAYLRRDDGVPSKSPSRGLTGSSGLSAAAEANTGPGLYASPSITQPKAPPTRTTQGTPLGAAPRSDTAASLGGGLLGRARAGGAGAATGLSLGKALSTSASQQSEARTPEPMGSVDDFEIPIIRSKPRAPAAAQETRSPDSSGSLGSIFGTPVPTSRERSQREAEEVLAYSSPTGSDLSGLGVSPDGADLEWLQDCLDQAVLMANEFPVQAKVLYNEDTHLPFTLEISRATPAMAVRSMMQFIAFLAEIATPPRARIELVSVPHLDRSFHRNVMAALEPHFPDGSDVERTDGRVEIVFHNPDPRWKAHPRLPV